MKSFLIFVIPLICFYSSNISAQDISSAVPVTNALDTAGSITPHSSTADSMRISAAASRNSVNSGESFDYCITTQWKEDGPVYRIIPPQLTTQKLSVGNVSTSAENVQGTDGAYKIRKYIYSITAEEPGTGIIEGLSVSYYRGIEVQPISVYLPPTHITILEPPDKRWQRRRGLIIAMCCGGLPVCVGIVLFFRYLLRRQKRTTVLSAAEQAGIGLEGVRRLLDNGNYNEAIDRLAEILRGFLMQQYEIPASARITHDTVAKIPQLQALSQEQMRCISGLLKLQYEAKYSGLRYERHEVRLVFDDISAFIRSAH